MIVVAEAQAQKTLSAYVNFREPLKVAAQNSRLWPPSRLRICSCG
jgi:hypothetical protein